MPYSGMLLLWLWSCGPEPEAIDPNCTRVCDELVGSCALPSFPDRSSCLDGCGYALQEGADVAGWADCADRAACDPFALVACEHAYGLE